MTNPQSGSGALAENVGHGHGPNGVSPFEGRNGFSSAAGMLKFKRDSYLRRRWFHANSFQHQGRANLNQLRWIAEQYLEPGRLVVDPMGGTGSLYILATDGFPVACGDVEAWLLPILKANASLVAQKWLFARATSAFRWDAAKLPFGPSSVPAIVTSPPYWDMLSDWHITSKGMQRGYFGPYGQAYGDDRGQAVKRNIGNIHVYEDYLRAMRLVYCEAWRVLEPGGVLALILKDRVHKARRVPIVRDTLALCLANGFEFVARHDCATVLSQYRRLNAKRNPGTEQVETETIVLMRKGPGAPPRQISLVAIPETFNGPPGQLFQKQVDHAAAWQGDVWLLHAPLGLVPIGVGLPKGDFLKGEKARRRREWCFDVCDELVKRGYAAGNTFMLHVPERYAVYLQQRLETFGCQVEIPTRGMNAGQKVGWLTHQVTKPALAPRSRGRKGSGIVQTTPAPYPARNRAYRARNTTGSRRPLATDGLTARWPFVAWGSESLSSSVGSFCSPASSSSSASSNSTSISALCQSIKRKSGKSATVMMMPAMYSPSAKLPISE